MDGRKIICISREHGSGGREVAEGLASRLGIPCYDKKLLEKVSSDFGVAEKTLEEADERILSWASMGFPMGIRNPYKADYDTTYYVMNDRLYDMQARTIRKLASEGSCIIVGRAAQEILKDDPDMVSVFIHAELEDRIKRIMRLQGCERSRAERLIRDTDRNRANYHNFYSDRKWGRCSSYDFSLSTTGFGVEGVVRIILSLIELL